VGQLAVIDEIDADLFLVADDIVDASFDFSVLCRLVKLLSEGPLMGKLDQLLRSRQRPHVGRQNPVSHLSSYMCTGADVRSCGFCRILAKAARCDSTVAVDTVTLQLTDDRKGQDRRTNQDNGSPGDSRVSRAHVAMYHRSRTALALSPPYGRREPSKYALFPRGCSLNNSNRRRLRNKIL
jgi:hypothetical protein